MQFVNMRLKAHQVHVSIKHVFSELPVWHRPWALNVSENPSGLSVLAMLPAPVRNRDVYIKVICCVYQMALI